MPDTPIDLHADLRQLLAWRAPRLRFEPEDERRFQAATVAQRLRHFRASGVLALLAFNLFLLADSQMVPDVFEQAVAWRLWVFTPACLALVLLGMRFKLHLARWPVWALEGPLMMTGVAASAILAWLLLRSQAPLAGMYMGGFVPVLIYGNLVQRFRFRYAVMSSLMVVGICVACVLERSGRALPFDFLDLPCLWLVSVVAAYTLIMNYRLELEERRRFMSAWRARHMRAQLAASQQELDELSHRDPLTGVPNRRQAEVYLAQQVVGHLDGRTPLSLLLLDVDHFKAFNDHYGHPAGDQCLRHVAQALAQMVPPDLGCVARWGGEEFVVVLPGLAAAQALALAQGLCDAVRSLSLRHEASITASCVTISVGVAELGALSRAAHADGAASPTEVHLMAAADAALYSAKGEGRNRCVLAC